MTIVVQDRYPPRPSMSNTEQIAVQLHDSMHITSDSEFDNTSRPQQSRRFSNQGPPMEIVITSPPESPTQPPPPPPPPQQRSRRPPRRYQVGGGMGNVEVVKPKDANKVLGFSNRGKTAVTNLFTKIPVVSAQGAASILAKRIRNAKTKEQEREERPEDRQTGIHNNGGASGSVKSGRSGRSSVLSKAANFLTHNMSSSIREKKARNHVKPVDAKTAIPKAPAVIIPAISPQQLLDRIHLARGYSLENYVSLQGGYHSKPTELQQASYGTKLVEAVRKVDPLLLRRLLQAGLSRNPCNAFGESLLHMVCRRGDIELLREMLNAGSSVQVADDYGRTPLHDACWTTTPNFDIITEILNVDIRLFRILDCRGASPLSYIKKENWVQWIQFFHSTINKFWPPRDKVAKGEEPPPSLVMLPPNSRPIPDPPNVLSIEAATMVANGRLDPDVAREQALRRQLAKEESHRQQLAREESLRQQLAKQESMKREQVKQRSVKKDEEVVAVDHVPEPVEVSKPDEYPEADDDDDDSDSISTNTSASSTYSSSCSSESSLDDEED